MRTAAAVTLSALAHAALLAGAVALSHSGRSAPSRELVVQAAPGDVFASEEAAAPSRSAGTGARAAPSPPGAGAATPEEPAGGVQPGVPDGEASPVGEIRPEYPPMSRKLGEEGEAVFQLELRADGSVAEARLERSSGHARLDEAAAAALREARFEPASRAGAPAPSTKRFHVEFRLRR